MKSKNSSIAERSSRQVTGSSQRAARRSSPTRVTGEQIDDAGPGAPCRGYTVAFIVQCFQFAFGSAELGFAKPYARDRACTGERGIKIRRFPIAEIFKMTPSAADLKRGGRYVAKDLFETFAIPLLIQPLCDRSFLRGELATVVSRMPYQDDQREGDRVEDGNRSSGKLSPASRAVEAVEGNPARKGGVVNAAVMRELKLSGRAGCLAVEARSGTAEKHKHRKFSVMGPAGRSLAVRFGGLAEKACYACI